MGFYRNQSRVPQVFYVGSGLKIDVKPQEVVELDGAHVRIPDFMVPVEITHDDSQFVYPDKISIVMLGRMGDVVNILPLVNHLAEKGVLVAMCIQKEYSSVLEGCPAVKLVEWAGDFRDVVGAKRLMQSLGYENVQVAQCYGNQHDRRCVSFCIESWRLLGAWNLFGTLPLKFSRSESREHALQEKFLRGRHGKPVVLYNLSGHSSPFSKASLLLALLKKFEDKAMLVDLAQVKAERFYDLLGLYDSAALLVTTDTATLHLAEAARIPAVELLASGPTPWHGSVPKGNCILSFRYDEFDSKQETLRYILELLTTKASSFKVRHSYVEFETSDPNTRRRQKLAAETWKRESALGMWTPCPVTAQMVTRDSSVLGDPRKLWFIKDVIEIAAEKAQPTDRILFTNTDTCFVRNLAHKLELLNGEAYYGARRDFSALTRALSDREVALGHKYVGTDLFLFTKAWWDRNKQEMPDMLLGVEAWDKILRSLMKLRGGVEFPFDTCYHERHSSFWEREENRLKDPSQKYCRGLARAWLLEHRLPLEELA